MKPNQFGQGDIHLALDGELPAEAREDFQAWLRANPEMMARWSAYQADRVRLREALEPFLREPVPAAMSEYVDRSRRPMRAARWWQVAAAAAIFALGAAAGYGLNETGWPGPPRTAGALAGQAISAHLVYAAENRHLVEVPAAQRDHLVGWLSTRLATRLIVPDFSREGYGLVGGRLLPGHNGGAAQLMYEHENGDRISFYVSPDASRRSTGIALLQEGKGCAYYWLDRGYGYVVAGTSSEETLLALAGLAQRQFSGP